MTIKERLEELCDGKKIALSKVEKDLGFSVGYLSKINNHAISSEKLYKVASYFDVSMDYLYTGKTNSPKSSENAHLVAKIRNDKELTESLKIYFKLPPEKKKLVINLINSMKME
jgi:transcriptional regulator with XRE-family HTH domain